MNIEHFRETKHGRSEDEKKAEEEEEEVVVQIVVGVVVVIVMDSYSGGGGGSYGMVRESASKACRGNNSWLLEGEVR